MLELHVIIRVVLVIYVTFKYIFENWDFKEGNKNEKPSGWLLFFKLFLLLVIWPYFNLYFNSIGFTDYRHI